MAIYQFSFYEFADFTLSGIQQVGIGTLSNQTEGWTGGTLKLSSANGVQPIKVQVNDDEADFHDGFVDPGGSNQRLVAPISANGTTYPAGSTIELEFAIRTQSTEGERFFYVVRLNGANVGIASTGTAITPNVTYTVTGSQDGNGDRFGTFPQNTVPTAVPWNALACFTAGTLIDTPDGPRPVESLEAGNLVTTLSNGSQTLRWTGSRAISAAQMRANPALRPVAFDVGAVGNVRPLLVSRQHRILLNDWRAQVYFGEDEVLIAARSLANGQTIREIVPETGVIYVHLLFDRHEVILAEAALTESFHPGEVALGGLDDAQRREIEAIFPGMMLETRPPAFPIVKPSEALVLRLAT